MSHPILFHPDHGDVELIQISEREGVTLAYRRWGTDDAFVTFITGEAMVAGEATWLANDSTRRHALTETCTECLSGSPVPHDPSPNCRSGSRNHCTCDTCW
jgi:hypothetical protein